MAKLYYVNIPTHGLITWVKYRPIIEFEECEISRPWIDDNLIVGIKIDRGFKNEYRGEIGGRFFEDYNSARKEYLSRSLRLAKQLEKEASKIMEFRKTMMIKQGEYLV